MYVDFEAPWMNLDSSSSTTASLLQRKSFDTTHLMLSQISSIESQT